MSDTIKALSLWQPWASLVALGAKRIETRHWPTHYRGPLAIHAAKRWTSDERVLCCEEPFHSVLTTAKLSSYPVSDETMLPLGAIVAVGRLVACERMTPALIDLVPEPERSFGHYAPGRWMWMLEGVEQLAEPVLFRGHQGLFDVSLPDHPSIAVIADGLDDAYRP